MATQSQKQDHVSKLRAAATQIIDARAELAKLRKEWDWLGLSDTLTDEDCQGLTKAQIAAVYTTLTALETLLNAGHGTNLAAVRVG